MSTRRTNRERELDREIEAMESLAEDARQRQSYTPAAAALSKATALRRERSRMREARLAANEKTEAGRIERLRRLAESEGSFVAASKYADMALTLRAEEEARARAEEEAQLSAMGVDEFLCTVLTAIDDLPLRLVEQIATHATKRLGEEPSEVLTHPEQAEA